MSPYPPSAALKDDPSFPPLKDHLIASTGLSYYHDRTDDLAARVASRLERKGVGGCAEYLELLRDGPRGEAELDALIEDLTIGETFFFRHPEVFDALRDHVFPALIRRNQETRRLRIWSAGCATGAEPYSVAIALKRQFAPQLAGWEVSILGTDINRGFLARAAEGRFENWAFRVHPGRVEERLFSAVGEFWLIDPQYKEWVSFQYHNLVKHPFPSLLHNLFAFDLILCRNVTIYFSAEVVRRLVGHFHQSLVDGGWLVVGHSEPNVELFRAFRTVNASGAILYQKCQGAEEVSDWQQWAPAPLTGLPPAEVAWNAPPQSPAPAPVPARTGQGPPGGSVHAPFSAAAPPGLSAVRRMADDGDLDGAAAACRELLDADRLNPTAHFYQALILEQMGHHAETEQALRRAIYLDRNFTLAHYYLGLLYQKQGAAGRAVRSFQNVLDLLSREPGGAMGLDADDLTVADLKALTLRHLEVLRGP